jgi:hypothetical protein
MHVLKAAAAIGDELGYARGRAESEADIDTLIDLAARVDEYWSDADGARLDAIIASRNAIRAAAQRKEGG